MCVLDHQHCVYKVFSYFLLTLRVPHSTVSKPAADTPHHNTNNTLGSTAFSSLESGPTRVLRAVSGNRKLVEPSLFPLCNEVKHKGVNWCE